MRELLVERCEGLDEGGTVHRFDYYVVIDQMEVTEGFACESYGVKIAQTGGTEEMLLPNITTSVTKIDQLMERLTQNLVTPCTLYDVVRDWLE